MCVLATSRVQDWNGYIEMHFTPPNLLLLWIVKLRGKQGLAYKTDVAKEDWYKRTTERIGFYLFRARYTLRTFIEIFTTGLWIRTTLDFLKALPDGFFISRVL